MLFYSFPSKFFDDLFFARQAFFQLYLVKIFYPLKFSTSLHLIPPKNFLHPHSIPQPPFLSTPTPIFEYSNSHFKYPNPHFEYPNSQVRTLKSSIAIIYVILALRNQGYYSVASEDHLGLFLHN